MRVLLVVHDNDSYIHNFPTGTAYVAAALERAGVQVEIYNQDIHHWPSARLTAHLDRHHYDAVGIGMIAGYYPYRVLKDLSRAINESRQRPFYLLGGPGPTPEPEFFLRKMRADAVVMGEGEETVVELLQAVAAKRSLAGVLGVAFSDGDRVVVNPPRPIIEDVDSIAFPAYHKFPIEVYRLISAPHRQNRDFVLAMITGRGCPFHCNFCYRMVPGIRSRGIDSVMEEIRLLMTDYGVNYISFQDELLMATAERTAEICEAIIKAEIDLRWYCSGRLNFAKPKLLKLMRRAGCQFISYGIESLDDRALKNMKKSLSVRQINEGIKATLDAGISPGLNVIFGNIGETLDVLRKGVDFLLKHDDLAQVRTIRPVTPYPGSALYYHALEKGMLKDCADFYENKHLNSDLMSVNFTDLTEDEFHQALLWANTTLLKNHYERKMESVLEQTRRLYTERDINFRGYRNP